MAEWLAGRKPVWLYGDPMDGIYSMVQNMLLLLLLFCEERGTFLSEAQIHIKKVNLSTYR